MINRVLSFLRVTPAAACALFLVGCSTSSSYPVAETTGVVNTAAVPTLTVEVPAGRTAVTEHLKGPVELVESNGSAQLSYMRLSDGMRMATANEHTARPALSIIKLYIAAYVVDEGELEDKYSAVEMITSSNDDLAAALFEAYPESIGATAAKYGLKSTRAADRWGLSVTSTYDVMSFISQLLKEDPLHPVLVAMAQSDAYAADGYPQNYGTVTLSNVLGSKWGWSNDKDLHASVSFGRNFVVAAAIEGTAEELTDFVAKEVTVANLRAASKAHVARSKQNKPDEPFRLESPGVTLEPQPSQSTSSVNRARATE
ncbi:hypothetical protein [Corynebacterium phocae]|uniref:hypothetical protein n=1 Tax=Corynebacterium phocae TaxID=161895 RepID=UPI00095147BA|nr:hypothetical protein [Corynebacterium phocae]KAA8722512.1 hypothetical protein F4V58_08645 [Corynebacterium phocae]